MREQCQSCKRIWDIESPAMPHCADVASGKTPMADHCPWQQPMALADYVQSANGKPPKRKRCMPPPPLTWSDLRRIGRFEHSRMWHPDSRVSDYFMTYRAPSVAWPYSYADAAKTYKFQKWLMINHPSIAWTFWK